MFSKVPIGRYERLVSLKIKECIFLSKITLGSSNPLLYSSKITFLSLSISSLSKLGF
ncbi:MAG: hypothetical protein WCS81_03705 [archaeon]